MTSVDPIVPSGAPILVLEGVEKRFGGVHALRGVDFEIRPGEVHSLLGENGAGKSTLVKVIAGVHRPDAGRLLWEGHPLDGHSLSHARHLGIKVIYQQLNVIDHLTVGQNLALGDEPRRLGFIQRRVERARAEASLAELGVSLDPTRLGSTLQVAEKQLIEIARALEGTVRVLLMDEPTASLGEQEVERLFSVVRSLTWRGIAIVFISHKLDEALAISDRITVLRDGQGIGTVPASEASGDVLIRMMVGRTRGHRIERHARHPGRVVLSGVGISTSTGLRDVSFELREGEVLGVYGLLGSGRTELIRALYGADPLLKGTIEIDGERATLRSPADAKRRGMGMVPEERKQAAFPFLSVSSNITVASPDLVSQLGVVSPERERRLATRISDALRIRTPSIDEPLFRLSGGNQQKALVGRWLVRGSRILLLDDPTSGIDVGAKDEFYRLIDELTDNRTAVLMSSSELPELLALSDRMLVLHRGRIAGVLSGEELAEQNVLELAVSGLPSEGAAAG